MADMLTWEEFMIPTLRVLSSGKVMHWREFQPLVADEAHLTEANRTEKLPSGSQVKYENRIGWGVSFLTNVGALERPKRGHYLITDAGRQLLQLFPAGVRERNLRALGEDPSSPIRTYESTKPRAKDTSVPSSETGDDPGSVSLTPIEQVQEGVSRIDEEVAAELLDRLQGKEPAFFEQAVVDLLLAMGYGGTYGKGTVTQLTNDGGIDGVIDQDILGLSRVYIQAKRYAVGNTVARSDLQAFVGALAGKADRGVFITTSRFSEGAKTYAANVPTRIILIDGIRLAELMIRYGVGVQIREVYRVVEIDEDFFA
ncbi:MULTISPECIES: restriction endonuclease [unclassified Rathayibacter]|uniref:restriction endonuclease n=1 Tax=unclassified Rathayibacter TaxID=2609250 RepID=UPI000CE85B1B|nr:MULTISPECIES: restriction endonuclease [unclassified Rathayibacter]PPH78301.1 restriction endonuclease [Rathayibacter sp. AY1D4]PPH94357.1 restriction endonuclease [Rathayibacter sp. AY1D3]